MRTRAVIAILVWGLACAPAVAQTAAGTERRADLTAQIAKLVVQLDSDRFEVRSRAANELERLMQRSEASSVLAAEFSRALANAQTSFEVRSQLRAWVKRLPAAETEAAPEESAVAELLREAVSDSYATRAAATQRLAGLAQQPQAAVPMMTRLREPLADASLATDDYNRLLRLYEHARGAWLLSDPAGWKMPPVSQEQINRAVEQLVQPPPASHRGGSWRSHAAARRYLLDLFCQDELVPVVKQALETRLASAALEEAARDRLTEVLDWTRPALVAEIWTNRQQLAEQHLLVDVPRQSLTATRPSHFSRIDDRTAFCESGQNLKPGEYPVGLAIAHPDRRGWMCHLVNLPTPRRRMRYSYDAKRDEQQRLAELTERTLRDYTAEGKYLSELQIFLFEQLHPATASRLIGDYFLAVDDRRLEQGGDTFGGVNVSHHGRICFVLASLGTRDVAPGFLQALRKQRFLPPVAVEAPYDWPWIAALTIADREPWPEVDAWLASLLDRREPLIVGEDAQEDDAAKKQDTPLPELGATAAAMLLDRHEQLPERFGLESVNASVLRNVGCPAYRFVTSTGRQDVLRWWASRQKQAAQREKMP